MQTTSSLPRQRRLTPTTLSLALGCAFAAAGVSCVQAAEPTLPAVVVTGAQTGPMAWADWVRESDLAARRAATNDTASLLLGIPGLSVNGNGGVSGLPQLNGLADDNLNIQLDGMGLIASCPNHMNPVLSYAAPSQVADVTVYPGVVPVSVGGDAIGGAIEVKTQAPRFAAPGQTLAGGEVSAGYGSNGNARNLGLNAFYATPSFAIRYDGAQTKADDYSAASAFKTTTATGRPGVTLGRDVVGSTAYDVRNHALSLAWKGSDELLELGLGYQDVPYQLYPNQRMDMLGNTEKRVNLHWLKQFGWGSLDARVYHESVDHFMDFGADKRYWYGTASGGPTAVNGSPCSPISPTCAAGMPMYTQSHTTGVKLKASYDLTAQDVLRAGLDYQRYRLDDWWTPSGANMWPGSFINVNGGQRDRLGLWGEWQKQLTPQWQTLAGLRVEQVRTDAGTVHGYANTNGMGTMATYQLRDSTAFNALSRSRTDTNLDASVLARYTPSATQDIELGLGHSERSPNLYQRYPWSTWGMAAVMNNFVGDGNGYIGNPDLKPEKATTLSATVDWHAADRTWEFKAQPFYTHVADYIDAVQWNAAANAPATVLAKNQFVVLKYVNQTARLYGINLSGRMPLADGTLGRLGLHGVINYTRGENTTTGDNLYAIMPLNARLTLTQDWHGWSNALEWVLVKAKTQVSAVRNEIPTPGYGLLNVRASYGFRQARVDLGVDNVLNKMYFLPTGGAYVGQGTTMSINGIPWGIAVPGPGRSVYARLSVKF
ncbi:TonB-dependent receptor [Thiomonas sp.]|uniref:TonB-dependent receptor plug domain-containing protein n=1 Tax=Thiomonas sp. TaxID=2047785 RepID=UPI00260FE6BB|nr:TonB-dependent receptor [Thiomonas sp.]